MLVVAVLLLILRMNPNTPEIRDTHLACTKWTPSSLAVSLKSCEDKDTSLIVQTKRGFLEAMPLNCALKHLLSTPISSFSSPDRLKTSPHVIRATFTFKHNSRRNPLNAGKTIRGSKKRHTIASSQTQNQKKEFSVTCLLPVLTTTPKSKSHSHVHSCTVALICWVIKGDDDDYGPYYASLEGFQFNTEGPNGATVYLK